MNDSELIEKCGNTKQVALRLGESMATVSAWKKRGIPRSWRKVLTVEYPAVFAPEGSEGQPIPQLESAA